MHQRIVGNRIFIHCGARGTGHACMPADCLSCKLFTTCIRNEKRKTVKKYNGPTCEMKKEKIQQARY